MALRRIPDFDDGSRVVPVAWLPGARTIKQDPVQPVPVGGYVVVVFQVTGYTPDCDGSAMAQLEQVDLDGEPTGWTEECIGLHPGDLTVDSPADLVPLTQE